MYKDPTEFRERFAKWKAGEKPYKNGRISDEEYVRVMEKVAADNWQKWGEDSEDAALTRILNDNTYDYRGYYSKYPNSAANADTHWSDEFKTVWHPTFSQESIYSGKKSQFNPYGYPGGTWQGEFFNPQWYQQNPHSPGFYKDGYLKLPKFDMGMEGYKYTQAGKDFDEWWRITDDKMSKEFQDVVVRPKSRGGNTTEGNWKRQWSLKGEPGLEIVSPEFEVLSLGGGLKQMYNAYKHISGLKLKSLKQPLNSWIHIPKKQPYVQKPYSVSWDDFIREPKVGKYFDEGGEALVYESKDNPGYLIKLKSELGEGETLDDLEFMVNRDLHINGLPGTEPIRYKGFSVSQNPQRILDRSTGKPKTVLNERFYPIYEQRKLTPYHKVNTDAFKVDQEMLINNWAAQHGYEYLPNGWLKYGNIQVSDQGFNNFAFDAFGNMKFIDPMIQTF